MAWILLTLSAAETAVLKEENFKTVEAKTQSAEIEPLAEDFVV